MQVPSASPRPARPDSDHITSFSGEFAHRETERRFQHHQLRAAQSVLRSTLIFCAVFYLGFWLTDITTLGHGPGTNMLLLVRLTVALIAIFCAELPRRGRPSIGKMRSAACIAEAVALGGFMLIASQRPAEFHWHAMSLAIMLIVVYLYIPNRFVYATGISVAATTVFILLAHKVSPMHSADMVTMTMLLLLANAFGAVAAQRFNRASREHFRTQSALETAALRDHLTGCFNRRYLHEVLLDSESARAARFRHPAAVILCDLDRFKQINDTHGHGGGDTVLVAFAALLKHSTRAHIDSVVRYGGEEFLLILPETDLASAVVLAERLRAAFHDSAVPGADGKSTIAVSASFGVAAASFAAGSAGASLSDLIASADALMYQAKKNGRNRVEFQRAVKAAS
ncbi:MAG TPA: GGDEF domain-containing protein [Telluria sp.]